MKLTELNGLSEQDAKQFLMQCCTSAQWVERLVKIRPFSSRSHIKRKADEIWNGLSEPDFLQAFEGHPKIGDVSSLRKKYSNTKTLASGEQSSVSEATEQVIVDLSTGNDKYLQKFGFIFIVCATGKSAEEMLTLLQRRLRNDRNTELTNAAEEQRKIFQIRLDKLLETE